MPYHRFERRLAALLDSAPRLRALARSGYRRANYLLRGRERIPFRLHPEASMQRIAGGPADGDCFFGYYGIQPWTRDGRLHLFHRHRGETAAVEVCAYDRQRGAAAILATSRAWSSQQGSMAQWLDAGADETLVFNDVVEHRLACRMIDTDGRERTLDWPVQALRPGAPEAISLNYRRLARLRPEYGYSEDVANFSPGQPLESDGLWVVDLAGGTARLAVTLRDLAKLAPAADRGSEHKVNHAVYSPDGSRLAFMHRWFGRRGKFSRLYCAQADGSGLGLLLDHRMVSHYAWRDSNTLLAYARAPENGDCYYLVDVRTGSRQPWAAGRLERYGDGHPSWSPDGRWIVTDTYPDRARVSRLLLNDTHDGRVIEVGAFHSPWRFDGQARCDLHPRWDPAGTRISIDSAHEGRRSVYAIDVSRLLSSRA